MSVGTSRRGCLCTSACVPCTITFILELGIALWKLLRGSRDNSIYFCADNIKDIRPLVDLNFGFIEEDIERL